MMLHHDKSISVLLASFALVISVLFSKVGAEDLECSACELMVHKTVRQLQQTASKQQSFRVSNRMDSTGKYKDIQFAKSEARIVEILEGLCSSWQGTSIGISTQKDGTKRYVDLSTGGNFENVSLAGGTSSTLVETCERILENHDEKITAYLYKTVKKMMSQA